MASYIDAQKVEYALTCSTISNKERVHAAAIRAEKNIEPELVAAITNMGKHARIHPTITTPREELPTGFVWSCVGFLLNTNVLEVQVNQDIVKRDTEYLQQHAIVAYFVGGR